MADLRGFDANQVEPSSDFEPIPAGKYLALITESEMKANKAGTGNYLQFTFQILDGPHKNRLLWARLNLDNPNAITVQIAKAELSAICRAIGVLAPNDSTDLHNLPMVIHVKCKKRTDTGEITNEIKGFSKKESPTTAQAATASPPANSTPPWRR
jgi:Protein of unknown function (DUF669)